MVSCEKLKIFWEDGDGIKKWEEDLQPLGAHMFDIAQWGLGMDKNKPTEIILTI